jgi:hypothetical protein
MVVVWDVMLWCPRWRPVDSLPALDGRETGTYIPVHPQYLAQGGGGVMEEMQRDKHQPIYRLAGYAR